MAEVFSQHSAVIQQEKQLVAVEAARGQRGSTSRVSTSGRLAVIAATATVTAMATATATAASYCQKGRAAEVAELAALFAT